MNLGHINPRLRSKIFTNPLWFHSKIFLEALFSAWKSKRTRKKIGHMITKKAQAYWTSPFCCRIGRVHFWWCQPCSEPFLFSINYKYIYFIKYDQLQVQNNQFWQVLTNLSMSVSLIGKLQYIECSHLKSIAHTRFIFLPNSRSFDYFQGQGQVYRVNIKLIRSRSSC